MVKIYGTTDVKIRKVEVTLVDKDDHMFKPTISRNITWDKKNMGKWNFLYKYNKNHNYLFTVLDLYSRKIVGYTFVHSLEAYAIVNLTKNTYISRNKPSNLILHIEKWIFDSPKRMSVW